jgi:tRNA threonylcarbamoyl adenosine modification protein (Sua5/YciO/YrdC/YwlC family)
MTILPALDDPQVSALLQQGQVGIIPTDTIYGIAALATNSKAVERLYQLKKRGDNTKSGTVIAANVQQLLDLGIAAQVVKSVEHLWPNPLSIELPLTKHLAYLYQSGPHRAFRVVSDAMVRKLLEKTGPLLTTSVNWFGTPPATNLKECQDYFGDDVDFYVEGGELGNRPPSTVAIIRGGKFQIVRQGAVTIDESGKIV